MMNILLIDPATTAHSLQVAERKKLRRAIGYPGLGLITVAALCPPEARVRVVDESVEELDPSFPADLVGISIQAPTARLGYEMARRFRKAGIPVVLGGIHVSLNPKEARSHADAVVVGEAELTWPQLLADFRRGELKTQYAADELADLDASPAPRRDLLNNANYRIPQVVQASKGCPYGCEFCALHAFVGHSPRFRSVERVVEEISALPGKYVLFADDNIYSDPEYSKSLFHALRPARKIWVAESSWHIAYDEEALRLARQSGCYGLFVGFDSVNQQPLMRKVPPGKDVEDVYVKAIQNVQGQGIALVAAFVFGLDNDDSSVFEKSLGVALRGGANLVNFSVLVPYPGTPIFNRLRSEGRILEEDWSKYISPNVCFEPKRMSPDELRKGILWAQKEFYSLRNIMKISFQAWRKLGWAAGLLSWRLNVAQKKNWGKGSG